MRQQVAIALLRAAGGVSRTFWRIARQLFHETTGSLFIVFAVVGGAAAWREWRHGTPEWLVALAIGFSLLMAAFAVVSFRSARRVR